MQLNCNTQRKMGFKLKNPGLQQEKGNGGRIQTDSGADSSTVANMANKLLVRIIITSNMTTVPSIKTTITTTIITNFTIICWHDRVKMVMTRFHQADVQFIQDGISWRYLNAGDYVEKKSYKIKYRFN